MIWKTTLAIALGVAACGGSGVTGTAPPQAILSASFQPAADNTCSLAGQSIGIGIFPDSGANPTPVKSGQGDPLGVIGVTCTVHSSGIETYTVDAKITAGANTIFQLHGALTESAPDGGIPNSTMTLANNASPQVSYAQTDGGCRVTYQSTAEGVTGGRVWGLITCPAATAQGAGTCETTAEFRFENCAF